MTRRALSLVAAMTILGCGRAPASVPASAESESTPQAAAPAPVRDPWTAARARGIEFRAVGNEPGWYLELDEQGITTLVYAYGERQVRMPTPRPRVAGGVTAYDSVTPEHALVVAIRMDACSDGMSDQSYPLAVSVTIDETALRGCGRWLDGRK